jgi:hypothetical protein
MTDDLKRRACSAIRNSASAIGESGSAASGPLGGVGAEQALPPDRRIIQMQALIAC